MSGFYIDDDILTAIIAGIIALGCLYGAVRGFMRKRIFSSIVLVIVGCFAALVGVFFATFQIRMF